MFAKVVLSGLFAVSQLSLPATAAAAPSRDRPIDEIAADLAYGSCPLFLAAKFSLTGPELGALGFTKTINKQPSPMGEASFVVAKRPDGEISFGGVSGKVCTVVIVAAMDRHAVLARLRNNLPITGLDFKRVANPGKAPDAKGVAIETFRAPVDKNFLYVQHIHPDDLGTSIPIIVQVFARSE